ncbi:MAG TPA: hypothetical protein VF787_29085 [Thermoanaerobaculia bacterium]
MRVRVPTTLTVVALLFLTGCQIEPTSSIRSETIKDANVEEPLTSSAKKYQRALEVSNQVIDRIAARDYQRIYQENLETTLRAQISQQEFAGMLQKLERDAGPIVTYKRMQWAFDRGSNNGEDILTSTKIVQHQKGLLRYRFVFRDDGKYASLAGVHYDSQKN